MPQMTTPLENNVYLLFLKIGSQTKTIALNHKNSNSEDRQTYRERIEI